MKIHTENYKNYTINIMQDEDSESPRDWDNIGTMVCWHRKYHLGDEQPKVDPSVFINQLPSDTIILPLYLYDHSGLAISCSPFSCSWDSGQVGVIYCSLEKARSEYIGTDQEIREKIISYMISEVDTYNFYLQGDVAVFVIEDENGLTIDSAGGYYPDDSLPYSERWSYPISEARSSIDYIVKKNHDLDLQLCSNI
jgi:hypothetical protein